MNTPGFQCHFQEQYTSFQVGKKTQNNPLLKAVRIIWRQQIFTITHPRSFRKAEAEVTHSQKNTASCSLCFTELLRQKIYLYIKDILYKYLGFQLLRSYAKTSCYFFFICIINSFATTVQTWCDFTLHCTLHFFSTRRNTSCHLQLLTCCTRSKLVPHQNSFTESVLGHLHKGHSNEYMFNGKIMNSYL